MQKSFELPTPRWSIASFTPARALAAFRAGYSTFEMAERWGVAESQVFKALLQARETNVVHLARNHAPE